VHDVDNIYHVPLLLQSQNLHHLICSHLKIVLPMDPQMNSWRKFAESIDNFTTSVKICLIGKYSTFQDSYLSVIKALKHASVKVERDLDLLWVEGEFDEEEMCCFCCC
jgi:CTP synthase